MFADCPPRWNDDYAAPRPSAGVFDSPVIPICLNTEWASHLDGLLEQLLCPAYWQGTDEEVEAATQQVSELLAKLGQIEACPTEVRVHYIGEPFSKFTSTAPAGALLMNGIPRLQADYPALMAEIPVSWKSGNYFTLPNMATRGLFGAGTVSGFYAAAGDTFGEVFHQLTVDEMPAHTHTTVNAGGSTTALVSSGGSVAAGVNRASGSAGTGAAHNNMPPGLACYWFIQAE